MPWLIGQLRQLVGRDVLTRHRVGFLSAASAQFLLFSFSAVRYDLRMCFYYLFKLWPPFLSFFFLPCRQYYRTCELAAIFILFLSAIKCCPSQCWPGEHVSILMSKLLCALSGTYLFREMTSVVKADCFGRWRHYDFRLQYLSQMELTFKIVWCAIINEIRLWCLFKNLISVHVREIIQCFELPRTPIGKKKTSSGLSKR